MSGRRLTIILLAAWALPSCKDDLRVTTVSSASAAIDAFKIESAASLVTRSDYLLTWNSISANATYDVVVAKDAACKEELFQRKGLKENQLKVDFLTDGTYYLCVFANYHKSIVAAGNNGFPITFDRTSPVVQLPPNTPVYNGAFAPSILIEDLTTISVLWSAVTGPGELTIGNPTSLDPQIQASKDGRYQVKVVISDQAGNITEQAFSFFWDASGPAIDAGSSIIASSSVSLHPTVDSSAIRYEWSYSAGPNGGRIIFSDASAAVPTVTATIEGIYTLTLTAFDEAGNRSSDSMGFTWDTTAPQFVSAGLTGPASDGFINANDHTLAATILGSLVADGYDSLAYRVVPATTNCASVTNYSSQLPMATSSLLTADGSYKICIALTDAAQLVTYAASSTFVYDTSPALFTSISLANEAADATLTGSEHSLSHDLVSNLLGNDVFAVAYALVSSSTSCTGPLSYSGLVPKTDDSRFNAAGTFKVCVRVTDEAGNPSAYGESSVITYTLTVPVLTSLLGSNAAADGYINASEIGSTLSFLALSAATYTSAAYTSALDDTPAITCDGSQNYSLSAPPSPSTLSGDESYAVCVRLGDAAGNVVYGKSQTIVRDTTAPTFSSLALSGAANDGFINDAEKLLVSPLWSLSASGQATEAYTIALSNTANALVCDGSQNYNQSTIARPADLGSDGPLALCVRLTDAAGNISYGKSATVTRDVSAPGFTSLLGANGASDGFVNSSEANSAAALLSLLALNATGASYTAALDNTPAITCDSSQAYSGSAIPLINTLGADETYAVCVKLSDDAGNTTYGKSQSIVKDTTSPVFTALAVAAEAVDSYINNSEKNATTALWTLSATGMTATAYSAALSNTSNLQVCDSGDLYDQGTNIPGAAGLASDGAWTLCVELRDDAGNITYGKGGSIVRATAVPVVTAFALSGAASDAYINDSERSGTTALWTLSQTGATTTAYTTALSDASSALVCDGLQNYNQGTTVPRASDIASDGSWALCVKLSDAAGNITYSKSPPLTRDILAPVLTSLNGANAASDHAIGSGEDSSNLPLLTLVAVGHASASYTLALSNSPSAVTCDNSQVYDQASIPLISSLGGNGDYAVCVKLIDAAGNIYLGKSANIVKNTSAPGFASLAPIAEASDGFINNAEKNANNALWTLSQTGGTTIEYTAPLSNASNALVCDGSQTYDQGTTIPTASGLLSDDSWAICVRITDMAANVTYGKSVTIVRDIVAPTFTSLLGANGASDGYVKSSEASSTAALFSLIAVNSSAAAYTPPLDDTPAITCDGTQNYSLSAIPLISTMGSDETYAACVQLSDAAGNLSFGKSQAIIKDTVAPAFSSLAVAAEGTDAYINNSEKNATNALWTLSATGMVATAYSPALSDAGGLQVCDGGDLYDQGTSIPRAADLASDGAWTVCVELRDAAGNITWGKGGSIVRDIVAPTFTSLALAGAATDSFINSAEQFLVSALWSLNASGQAAEAYTTALDNTANGLVCDNLQNYNQSAIPKPSDLASDGAFALCVRLTDAAGNISYGKSATLTRDIVAPTFTSLNGANGASDLYIKNGEQNSALALFTLSATGATATLYTVAQSDAPTPITCDSGQDYSQSAIPLINSLTSDGSYAACVKLSDDAGNHSYGKSQTVVRDLIAPTFTSLYGANAAADGVIDNSEKSSTNPAWALVALNHSAAAYTALLDDSGGSQVCDNGQSYGSSSIPIITAMVSDGTYAICVELTDLAGNLAYGKSQQVVRNTAPPGAPGSFTVTPGNRINDISWTPSTGSPTGYLLVRGAAGSAPTFAPTPGQTYTPGAQGSDEILAVGLITSQLDTGLTLGTSYSYKVWAYDAVLTYSTASSASATPITPCPTGYVFVSADADYGTGDFCMMKYEAKDSSGIAVSTAAVTPWQNISMTSAMAECFQLGTSYHLVANDEWMSVASQVASLGSNWSGLAVGTGVLSRGHADANPNIECAASTNDTLAYVEGTCSPIGPGGGENNESDYRRTNNLANGEVIWDLAGNLKEMINSFNLNEKPYMLTDGAPVSTIRQFNTLDAGFTALRLRDLVPTHAVKPYWIDTWSDIENVGIYKSGTNGVGGAISRGGGYTSIAQGGPFTFYAFDDSSATSTTHGFRCVASLDDLDPASLSLTPANGQITANWSAVGGATGYLLVRSAANSYPTFSPNKGTSYSTGSQGSDQIVYVGTSLSKIDTGLDNGKSYTYTLYSYNGSSHYSAPTRAKETPRFCPNNYVLVPGDASYGTEDFCAMQYEAKAVGTVAASDAANAPWTSISLESATTACRALGPGYHLLNNSEWMTLGVQVSSLATNWTGAAVGTGTLFAGHSDNNPPMSCQASSNSAMAYVESNCIPAATGDSSDQKRVLNVANGVIWDFTGNVAEAVHAVNALDKPGASLAYYEYSALSGTTTMPLKTLVPTNAIKSYWSDAWNSNQRIGTFYPDVNSSGGGLRRGSDYTATTGAGLFAADLVLASTSTAATTGFRCALGLQLPNTPRAFTATVRSGSSASLSWLHDGSTSAGYLLVRGATGLLPTFQPAQGTTYTTGAQGSDTILSVGLNKGAIDTGLTTGSVYHYALYAYDASHNYSSQTFASVKLSSCPDSWVLVPGDPVYGTQDFCIMKYEAKDDGSGNVVQSAGGSPWATITQEQAMYECSALGPNYHLLSNDEWMSATANIAARTSNWSGAALGSGYLYRGHTDNSPPSVCAASTNDTLAFVETNCTAVASVNGTHDLTQKRASTLSNGQVVWDLSGNAWEAINYINISDRPYGSADTVPVGGWRDYSLINSGFSTLASKNLRPTHATSPLWVDSWNSATNSIGSYFGGTYGSGGGSMRRGGSYSDTSNAGLFSLTLFRGPTNAYPDSGFRCARSLADFDSSTFTLKAGTTSIAASWASTGATGYLLVRGAAGGEPSFVPADGSSYSTGSQGSDTILVSGNSLSYPDAGLTNGTSYSYALFSYDASDRYTLLARDAETPVSCPTGFVLAHGDLDYGTDDFCVMKYEAKNNSSVPISQDSGTPWVSITQENAKTECTSLGSGYELINNYEWMTIANQIAARSSNWSSGVIGSDYLISGHNDNDPTSACAASANDSLAFVEGSCTALTSGGDTAEQRRTHTLSSGDTIWDISGNVLDWVNDFNSLDKPTPTTAAFYEYSALTFSATAPMRSYIPTHAVKSYWDDSWNSTQFIGKFYPGTASAEGGLARGGYYNENQSAGMFTAKLNSAPTGTAAYIGFRCVKHRP